MAAVTAAVMASDDRLFHHLRTVLGGSARKMRLGQKNEAGRASSRIPLTRALINVTTRDKTVEGEEKPPPPAATCEFFAEWIGAGARREQRERER